ncbi:MAG: hypothetical protein AVDCRST_MAG08-2898, partial [uncultured Acetobacteraceae bacterium]
EGVHRCRRAARGGHRVRHAGPGGRSADAVDLRRERRRVPAAAARRVGAARSRAAPRPRAAAAPLADGRPRLPVEPGSHRRLAEPPAGQPPGVARAGDAPRRALRRRRGRREGEAARFVLSGHGVGDERRRAHHPRRDGAAGGGQVPRARGRRRHAAPRDRPGDGERRGRRQGHRRRGGEGRSRARRRRRLSSAVDGHGAHRAGQVDHEGRPAHRPGGAAVEDVDDPERRRDPAGGAAGVRLAAVPGRAQGGRGLRPHPGGRGRRHLLGGLRGPPELHHVPPRTRRARAGARLRAGQPPHRGGLRGALAGLRRRAHRVLGREVPLVVHPAAAGGPEHTVRDPAGRAPELPVGARLPDGGRDGRPRGAVPGRKAAVRGGVEGVRRSAHLGRAALPLRRGGRRADRPARGRDDDGEARARAAL